ncbi:MAG: molybdopterin converting factor subunit 1 [Polyangiaceae bacterium]
MPVAVRVLYFGGLRDDVGLTEESLMLPPHIQTVGDLRDHLAGRRPAYGERRGSVRIARNETFASDDERLSNGDVIALIPPVAGG